MTALLRVFLFLALVAFVSASSSELPPTYLRHQRRALEKSHLHKRQNVSSTAITEAQKLVDAAVKQQGEYNTYRVANPRTNNYYAKTEQAARKGKRENEPSPPTIDSSVRAAAALLAEHTAAAQAANGTLHRIYKQPSSLPRFDDYAPSNLTKRGGTDYWLADITHNGLAPM
ncbi:hypothetical protein BP6252_12093 [Coleophoma cylindrospora]|uniref:SCP domain-containing protein n=1 Tax=Coleophoma cylindrospora TaxID=1849047 RepID=A0A3D8QGA7_9HELO|nr:hypothetical protein BP6252_12093 [Coleophoma cylindrospora]